MKVLVMYITLGVCFISCRHENRNKEMDLYFTREINNRITLIREQEDSMKLSPVKIDRDVNNLVLLSKDVENLGSTIDKANRYFSVLAADFQLNPSDFASVNNDMKLNDIASILRENELNFFNQVIFKAKKTSGNQVYTAH